MNAPLFSYIRLAAALAAVAVIGQLAPEILALLTHASGETNLVPFFAISLIFILSFGIFYLAQGIHIPNFVIAIFFGMAARPLLEPVTHNHSILGALVGFGATLILFGGGLETPFASFKRLIFQILSLSFVGLGLTAFVFAVVVYGIGSVFGAPLSIGASVLLGALLASTDPAAIIPILKRLRFRKTWMRDLIVSESAVTDVTGTLLTVIFLGVAIAGTAQESIVQTYASIFSLQTLNALGTQIIFGALFGFIGFSLLSVLTRFKVGHDRETEADAAFFLFIPVVIFTFAIAFGGSGYLAAFIAGLLFVMNQQLHETERFFNHVIDGFFKPTIFLLLGALVDVHMLIEYAPLGIAAAALFIFVLRPLAVFASLGPFAFFGKDRPGFSELLFISWIRETGAIPAVLLVTVVSLKLSGMEGLLPVGMWVILATLVIQPPLTPFVARRFGVADLIQPDAPAIEQNHESFVVLGTRGYTYRDRLPFVADWAVRHSIRKVVLLLCLEYRYQPEMEQHIQDDAMAQFAQINESLTESGFKPIKFSFVSSAGLLQENIDYIAKHQEQAVTIFVGRKMLDYRLDEIKKLRVPLFFLE